MKLRCIQLELPDGVTIELKGKYKTLDELKTDIVHRIFQKRLESEEVRSAAVMQTAIDTGYNSVSAVEYILNKSAP